MMRIKVYDFSPYTSYQNCKYLTLFYKIVYLFSSDEFYKATKNDNKLYLIFYEDK